MNNATQTTTPAEPTSVTEEGWTYCADGVLQSNFFRLDHKPTAAGIAFQAKHHNPGAAVVTVERVSMTRTTTPTTVRQWHHVTLSQVETVTFKGANGADLRDRKGRKVGALVSRFETEVEEVPATISSCTGWDDRWNYTHEPATLDEDLGTRRWCVEIQSARSGETFGASFPKTYRFANEALRDAHIAAKLDQAERRQLKRKEAGKL